MNQTPDNWIPAPTGMHYDQKEPFMNLAPLDRWVILTAIDAPRERLNDVLEVSWRGRVVAVGADRSGVKPAFQSLQEGDEVLFLRQRATTTEIDGIAYLVVRQEYIQGRFTR